MATRVEELVEEIKSLSPEEQQRLRETLEIVTTRAAVAEQMSSEEELKLRLLEKGLIKEIKRPPRDLQKAQEEFLKYNPVPIAGKPLSETIIEERR